MKACQRRRVARSLLLLLLPGALAATPLAAAPAPETREQALDCLAAAIAHEAGREPEAGQQAVAEVVLNRQRHRAYPRTVCGVIYAGAGRRSGCQFTFTCDGSLARRLPPALIAAARRVAETVLDGAAPRRMAGATHYHADYVQPWWAPSLVRLGSIGRHIFYRLPGAEPGGTIVPAPDAAATAPAPPAPPPFAPWGLVPHDPATR